MTTCATRSGIKENRRQFKRILTSELGLEINHPIILTLKEESVLMFEDLPLLSPDDIDGLLYTTYVESDGENAAITNDLVKGHEGWIKALIAFMRYYSLDTQEKMETISLQDINKFRMGTYNPINNNQVYTPFYNPSPNKNKGSSPCSETFKKSMKKDRRDGNLVVKRKLALNKTIVWTSKTNIDDEVKFSLSNQGIATITDKTGKELWSKSSSSVNETENLSVHITVGGNTPSDTKGNQSTSTTQNEVADPASRKDPNILLSPNKCGFNPSECKESVLKNNQVYKPGNFICSPNSKFQFGLTASSKLCICNKSGEEWCVDSCCSGQNLFLRLQMDGNIVVRNQNNVAWNSHTDVNAQIMFLLLNDGVATMKDKTRKVIWSSPKQNPPITVIMSSKTSNAASPPTVDSGENWNKRIPQATPVTFVPGLLVVNENGLVLSKGLKSKGIAKNGTKVKYGNGSLSAQKFHIYTDAGAIFKASDGGFIYVSNSEDQRKGKGGVGIIRFNRKGNIVDYKMILTGTMANCGGSKTSWNTWLSCEEKETSGQVYETDPFGEKVAKKIRIGGSGRNYESVACDKRNFSRPVFYLTNDSENGELCQYLSINKINEDTNKWSVL